MYDVFKRHMIEYGTVEHAMQSGEESKTVQGNMAPYFALGRQFISMQCHTNESNIQ